MSRRRVSLADVARDLNTTPATVSRGLRNDPRISAAMKDRIRERARIRGYTIDPETSRLMAHVRSLREKPSGATLAFLVDADDMPRDPYTRRLIQGATARSTELGFRVDVLNLHDPGMTQARMETILYTRSIRGVLIPPHADLPRDVALPEHHVALVAATAARAQHRLHRVFPDHFANVRLLLEQLVAHGRTRFGLVTTRDMEERQRQAPLAAYLWFGHQCSGVSLAPPRIIGERGISLAAWYARYRPDVLIVPDTWILEDIRGAWEDGPPPAVVLFGNQREGFAGIDERPEVIGSAAIDLLSAHVLRQETGYPRHPKSVMIAGTFREGASLPSVGPRPRRGKR